MRNTAIAIFGYRRPDHLRRVLESLMAQQGVPLPPIHLFLDGPRSDQDVHAMLACRAIAESFADHCDLTLEASPVNQGLYSAITRGVTAMLNRFEQLIVLEDDTLVSPYFLEFMLDGLACYTNVPAVASIHGYLPPLTIPLPDTFFLRGADCWGWATWRDRWMLFRSDAAAMALELRQRGLARAFDMGGRVPNLHLLDQRAASRSSSWAICWHASCFLADRYTLHPGRSLVRNIGLDASGEHCLPSAALIASLSSSPVPVVRQTVEEDPAIMGAFARQVGRRSLPQRVLGRLSASLRRSHGR